MTPENQPEPSVPNPPNSSAERTPRKRLTAERRATDYPTSRRPSPNPLVRGGNKLSREGEVRFRLGLTDSQMAGVPSITRLVGEATGSVAEAIEILSGDDAEDSIKFMAKWNSLSPSDQRHVKLEEVIIAAGLTTRRFKELLAGASSDEFTFKALTHKTKVLKSAIKAATTETPIVADVNGTNIVVGHEPADVKAMELFFKLTGDIKPSGGVVVNSNNQTANISPVVERPPLQSMDSWLLEIDDVRKPKQLNAPPVIPVEMPVNAPEIEYMPLGDE